MRIKNIIRKATVAALTAVMILAPIVNVKAASSDVIDTSKTGSITIHKYDMTAAKQAGVNLDQFTSTGKQGESDNAYVNMEVTNQKQFLLPMTGGAGSYLLIIAGVVIAGCGFIIIKKNKKRKEVQ